MSKVLDRLTLLETFVRIADCGSISAASRDLGLSQPSVSRQLAALEERFGSQLMRRTTHSLALTPAGTDLLADARSLLDGWEALVERHGQGKSSLQGRLKVIAPVALGQMALADLMVGFQKAHPEVSVDWSLQDEPIRFAEAGCDCWIKVGEVPDDTLIVRPLAQIERLVVARPDVLAGRSIGRPEDLADLPCIALAPFEGGQINLNSHSGEPASLRPPVALSTNNIVALHRALVEAAGFAIMPRWFVEADLQSGRLVDLLPDWRAATLTLNVAYLPNRHQPLRLKRFLEHLAERVAALPGLGGVDSL